jgi:NADP-dependent 3-hydroxy acid dehydrogenase YdfG
MKAPKQKVALVTEGSSGIGLTLAQEQFSAGYRLINTAKSTSAPSLDHLSLQVMPVSERFINVYSKEQFSL